MVTGKWFWWCPKHSSHMERSTNGMQCSGLRHGNLGKLVPLQMKHFFPYSNGVNEEIKLCLEPLPAVGMGKQRGLGMLLCLGRRRGALVAGAGAVPIREL